MAVSFIAEKHDLQVSYSNVSTIERLGIQLFSGKNVHATTKVLTNDNYFETLNQSELSENLDPNNAYFQTKEIVQKIYDFICAKKEAIMSKNPFSSRYSANNDCFVHIRLGDVPHYNVGFEYYNKVISSLNYDTLFISSDSPSHGIIRSLRLIHKRSVIVDEDEVGTIQFASTCKHIVLSHGSFSSFIGYVSFFSDVYYPAYSLASKVWHGDIFDIPGWTRVGM
jgi:hypothetical protein